MQSVTFMLINSTHSIYKQHQWGKMVIFRTAHNHLYLVLSYRFSGSFYLMKNLSKLIVTQAGCQLNHSIFHHLPYVRLKTFIFRVAVFLSVLFYSK